MSQSQDIDIDFVAFMEPAARIFLGEPNRALSSKHELRYGRNGSLSFNLKAGTFFDHETKEGGGTLDFIKNQIGCTDRRGALEWLEKQGLKKTHGSEDSRRNGGDIEYDAARDPIKGFQLKRKSTAPFRIVKTWPYVDENGVELFEVCRLENGEIGADGKPQKTYRQRHKTPDGYVNSVRGIRQVPYRLPALIEAISRSETVFIVEGEKCADAVVAIGGIATCNAMGAGKWPDELTRCFKEADVVILPDKDEPGAKHAGLVAGKLQSVAKRIQVLELLDFPQKGDVADWIAAGGTLDNLYALVETNGREPVADTNESAAGDELDLEIARLATLRPADYERERKGAAKRLG
jgi:putative DNA primase/helicase